LCVQLKGLHSTGRDNGTLSLLNASPHAIWCCLLRAIMQVRQESIYMMDSLTQSRHQQEDHTGMHLLNTCCQCFECLLVVLFAFVCVCASTHVQGVDQKRG
jgi:hypothetical protein